MSFKSEKELVDVYLKMNELPYTPHNKNPNIEKCREFEMIWPQGLVRLDLLFINHSDKRYDIIEFKNRPLELKDAYQVYKYMKAFYYNKIYKKSFSEEYESFFHLVGEDWEDKRVENLVLMQSEVFKIHVFYGSDQKAEFYDQCLMNLLPNLGQWI